MSEHGTVLTGFNHVKMIIEFIKEFIIITYLGNLFELADNQVQVAK